MNTNLLNTLKEIVSRYGGVETLSDARRVKALLADLAATEPRPQKNALIACLERGFAAMLQNVPAHERGAVKTKLAERLNREEGLDPALCTDTLDMLEAALFGNVSPKPEPKATEMPGTPAPQKPEEALYKISFNFQQSGPYNMAQLLRMAEDGQITKDHWICPVGASEWAPITTIAELKGSIEAREKAQAARVAAEKAAVGLQTQPAPPPQDEVPVNDPGKKAKQKSIVETVGFVGLAIYTYFAGPEVLENILGPVPAVIEFVVLGLMFFFAVGIGSVICDKIFDKD
jgi:hypothetical protein